MIVSADGSRGGEKATTERSIVGKSCVEIGHAMAVILALAMVDAAERSPTPSEVPLPTTVPPPSPQRRTESIPRPVSVVPARQLLALGAGATATLGSLPSPGPGFMINSAWRPRPFRVGLEVGAHWPQRVAHPDQPSIGGEFQLMRLAVRGCYAPLVGRFELGGCAGTGVERLAAVGFGGERRYRMVTFWPAVRAGAFGAYPLGRSAAIVATVEVTAPLVRSRFVLSDLGPSDGASVIFSPSSAGGQLSVGVEARIF